MAAKKSGKKTAKKTAKKTVRRVVRLKGRGSSGRVNRPTRGLGMRTRKAAGGDCPPAEVVTKVVYRERPKKKATKKASKKRKKTTTATPPRKGQKKVVGGYVWTCAGLVKRGCGGGAIQLGSARRVSSKMTEINKRLKKLGIKGRLKG